MDRLVRPALRAIQDAIGGIEASAGGKIRAGYRRIEAETHSVFCRKTKDGVLIVRVLHQTMDFGRHAQFLCNHSETVTTRPPAGPHPPSVSNPR